MRQGPLLHNMQAMYRPRSFCMSDQDVCCMLTELLDTVEYIVTDKALFSFQKMLISFLFLHKNIYCGYSLEAPC